MPEVVEPGTRLVQRYRLDERLGGPGSATSAGDGAEDGSSPAGADVTYWRAHDELLDRPVGVCLLRTGMVPGGPVLRAARKAAVLTDPRFLRVLDASEVDGVVYVVSEWVSATSLDDLLAAGPLQPEESRALVAEVAGALAAAHEAGLAHLCLGPEHVLRTAHGQVKLAGLAVDAAARGIGPTDPAAAAATDTRAATALMYAALTARWPGDTPSALPPAPRDGDEICSPRQVRAGVPDDLDRLVCRGLGLSGRSDRPVRTPADLEAELAELERTPQRTVRLPLPDRGRGRVADEPAPYVSVYDDQGPPRRRVSPAAVSWTLATLLLLGGLVLALSQLLTTGEEPADDVPAAGPSQGAAGSTGATVVRVRNATSFDPPPGNGDENSDRAAQAVDGDPTTGWTTKTYLDPFGPGGLKEGVGLVLDLGKARDVTEVSVEVAGGETELEVRTARRPGSELGDYTLLANPVIADPDALVRPGDPVRARYVLVWLTSVPDPDGSGNYRGEVAEVEVSAARG